MEGGESIVSGFPKNMETDPPEVSEVVVAAPAAPQVINMERSIVEVGMFKKKRGRPRKYAPDGTPLPPPPPPPPSFPSDFSVSSEKRSRGRPPGAANRKKYAFEGDLQLSSALAEFTPHLLTINTGEDLAGKIFSIAQMGPLSICIMSCNGPVSTVTISQPGSSGGTLTYEGRFEILSLKGSFIPSHSDSRIQSTNGGLSISLAGPDGRVIGGVVAGSLIAASPIQLVLGSFLPDIPKKRKKKNYIQSPKTPAGPAALNIPTMVKPVSEAKPDDDTCRTSTSALQEQSQGEAENSTSSDQIPNITFIGVAWHHSQSTSGQKASPDINAHVAHE